MRVKFDKQKAHPMDNLHAKPDWSQVRLKDLESHSKIIISDDDIHGRALRDRYDAIKKYITGKKIIPNATSLVDKFKPVIAEVLARLPDDVFNEVTGKISFMLNDCGVLTFCVATEPEYIEKQVDLNAGKAGSKRKKYTIVINGECWELSQKSLIGLVASQIGSLFADKYEEYDTERIVPIDPAEGWGFSEELICQETERPLWISLD